MIRWLLVAAIAVAGLFWLLLQPSGRLVHVGNFGDNPTSLDMHVYVPRQVSPHPAVVLALHWCTGSGPAFHSGTGFARLADQRGFIVIYPSATRASRCWDVHSPAALTHGGGSDPQGLLSMIRYAVERYGADNRRVFVTGHSSGAMMTQLLLGVYPEVFHAGAAFAGAPVGCFAGENEWNDDCALGRITKSADEWSDIVRRAYPSFSGTRPAVQIWHGTADDALSFHNFGEATKQWTSLLQVSANPASVEQGTPANGWTRSRYVSASGEVRLETLRGEGQPHNFRIAADEATRFFGL